MHKPAFRYCRLCFPFVHCFKRVNKSHLYPHFQCIVLFYFIKEIFWCILFLKSLLNLLQYYFCLFLFCFDFCHKACGIPAPQPGTEPSPPELEGKVLTTELPRKSPTACFKMTKLIMSFVNLPFVL